MKFLREPQSKAFSLVELLVVTAMIAVLAALATPAISSLGGSGKLNQTLVEVAGIFEQARQYAVSKNTPVWVAMDSWMDSNGIDQLAIVVLASLDGTDPSPWSDYGSVPNASIEQISRVRVFSQLQLKEPGTFSENEIPTLSGLPSAGPSNALASGTAEFSVNIPGSGNRRSFRRVVEFAPAGQARNAASPIDFVEFGLQAAKVSNVPDANQVSVFRVNGLTGQTQVFRR